MIKLARDSFQLVAYAHRDLTNLRRHYIRPAISDKYQQLCQDSTPLTENLLVDDLDKQLRSLDKMQRTSSRSQCPMHNRGHIHPNIRGKGAVVDIIRSWQVPPAPHSLAILFYSRRTGNSRHNRWIIEQSEIRRANSNFY